MVAVVIVAAVAVGVYAATHLSTGITKARTGYLTVAAQDPGPIAGVEFVYVEATQIQVHDVNGTWITVVSEPTQVKLNYVLNTTGVFTKTSLPAGSYNMVRIIIPSTGVKVTVNTTIQPLPGVSVKGLVNVTATVPSGAQTGIKIYTNFTIQPGATYTLILHFHLIQTGRGSFILTPQTNASTSTTTTQFVSQLFQTHMRAAATDNQSTLSQEYTAQAKVNWTIRSAALNASLSAVGQNISTEWSTILGKLNITGYTATVKSVNVTGSMASAEGYITLNITMQGKTYSLTLVDNATYVYNGQVWLINSEQVS